MYVCIACRHVFMRACVSACVRYSNIYQIIIILKNNMIRCSVVLLDLLYVTQCNW